MLSTMKQLFVLVFILASFSTVSAQGSNAYTNNNFKDVIFDSSLKFEASNDNGKIHMSWEEFSNPDENFTYYKIVRSEKNSDPIYPNDGYIKYESDISKTEYSKMTYKQIDVYYRVCAITSDKDRYCSNVISLKEGFEGSKEDYKKDYKKNYTSVKTYGVSYSLKKKANKALDGFIKKVEAKYSSSDDRIASFDKIIARLETLAETKPRVKDLVKYMISYLNSKKEKYNNDFDDIEDIFSDF
ncbi:hypothetical protein A9Q91_04815 [Candidatus Gracilibacteria bacterium 28_42_T64]|nr:hypothetical protein A9Q91_04815 [Candidatus Gracilibacteria bacterium 28_42_T64]